MSGLYTQTLKYFHLAITEFLPCLKELRDEVKDESVKEELADLIEAYEDIGIKIEAYNLNYEDPNKYYDGEPDEIDIDIPNSMIENLARLSHRMLFTWRDRLEKLKNKAYLTDKNKEEAYRLEKLIWPLEARLNADSHILGKHSHLGPSVFPGESSKTGSDTTDRLATLLQEIQQCYSLGDNELLESKRLKDAEAQVRTELGEVAESLTDETLKLKYKKLNSGWQTELKSGFHNRDTAESKLEKWKILAEEMLEHISGTKPVNEAYFSAGQSFDAVKIFRSILISAKKEIWIEDNFMHPTTLKIVEPYINGGGVNVRLLTKSSSNGSFNSFCVDLKKIRTQYPALSIKAKENSQCHDRYIIIDGTNIYHSGHSFHDLGEKASQINKVEDEEVRKKIIADFESWWNTGNVI